MGEINSDATGTPEELTQQSDKAPKVTRKVANLSQQADNPHARLQALAAETHSSRDREVPDGFVYDPDLLANYDEQVDMAIQAKAYQDKPIPSFESVPMLDIMPTFNPTGASLEETYAHDRVPEEFRRRGIATHAELTGSSEPIEMWRIVDRDRLVDGSGLVASAILLNNTLGNVEQFNTNAHISSNHEGRMADLSNATPFVSFSTDPEHLARRMILHHGFGVNEGRDSVITRVRISPHRVITSGKRKEQEALLLGGVAPDEYIGTYSITDFVNKMVPDATSSPNTK